VDALWRDRIFAALALAHVELTTEQKEAASALLCDILAKRQTRFGGRFFRYVLRAAARFAIACVLTFLLIAIAMEASPPESLVLFSLFTTLMVIACLLCVSMPLISLLVDAEQANRLRATAADVLGYLRVPQSVPTLAVAAMDSDILVRDGALAALHATLPSLTTEHYGAFPARTTWDLGRLLMQYDTPMYESFVLEVLNALEKVGDGGAIEGVGWISEMGGTESLREEADRVLAILCERQQQQHAAERLLRPADAASSDTLLRPAGNTETDPQRLLRASRSPSASAAESAPEKPL
jgi:hypothetical protein